MDYYKHKDKIIVHVLLIPLLWTIFTPLAILDFFISIYHYISFPVYGFKRLKRSDYIVIDRYKLQYLNLFQKLNCVYCSYANGILNYAFVIAAMTEQYWCGIKHQSKEGFVEPDHHCNFIDYDDKEAFDREYIK